MKFQELKERFKNRFSMRMMAGVLCIVLAGGSIGAYQLQAEQMTEVDTNAAKQLNAAAKKGKKSKRKNIKTTKSKQ